MRRKKMFLAAAPLAALLPLVLTSVAQTAPAEAATSSSCAAVSVPAPAGARIESVQAAAKPAKADVPAYCEITVTLTHGSAGDHVKVAVALPLTGWTGRLQAVGGSAYTAGDFGAPLVQAVKDGYSGVTTDAGVPLTFLDTSWALTDNGEINKPLVTNFATRSVHEAAVIGKDVTRKFYQRAVSYSYWNGCSTGGRQGYSEAQRYPGDFDGVLANAPAVHWAEFAVATLWPQVVMNQDKTFPSDCVFSAFRQAAIEACDGRDGVTDGIVDRPDECGYDPRSLIGTKVHCGDEEVVVTAADAEVVRKIWAGPTDEHGRRLWPGLPKSAEFGPVTNAPGFPVALGWVRTFLKKQPGFDASKITYRQFAELFRQSVREYDDVIGTSDPDLSDFRRAGGKLITFVGTDDQLIPPGGTLRYRHEVERELGGPKRVNEFYRLFFAPGVTHCAGGAGAAPTNALGALVDWVEHGKAPSTLPAANGDKTLTRDLCPYPQVSRYRGHGDPAVATSYRCAAH
ncbi:tannase/feruloyl esterase family alpha/beta hydrolase [Amycolatopsis sp. BJA-103]|uniref:tannase/feruloyl esterase family alpha/beta hydrolase n=1 Tax=Amycolatopsis sp. BJA-103 TaxID=1911175 RepID=UPI000C7714B0|nr:tannase/feruloyl esterase family alpha/beta hydrolase [Amycolatopsis sp. BJA-103]AUI59407.1 tannase [Amycolatopsis sp. BJA-103]PNE17153.1 tannase [Amycolatopsis sp. BJA-103]